MIPAHHFFLLLARAIGVLKPTPTILDHPALDEAREARQKLREQSLLIARDLRTENLARLQRRLSGDV